MENKLGKIENVFFGVDEGRIGLRVTLNMQGSEVVDYKYAWDPVSVKITSSTLWTEKDRDKNLSEVMRLISKTISEAKVNDIQKLKGIPIEATLEGNTLKKWRVLTEVL